MTASTFTVINSVANLKDELASLRIDHEARGGGGRTRRLDRR